MGRKERDHVFEICVFQFIQLCAFCPVGVQNRFAELKTSLCHRRVFQEFIKTREGVISIFTEQTVYSWPENTTLGLFDFALSCLLTRS